MRAAIATSCLLVLFAALCHAEEVLITPSFKITIIGCEEGVVACDDVKYVGVSKKTGATLRLTGRTIHSLAPDGTPNRFMGYEFKNGNTVYSVSEDGSLEVRQGTKVLVAERGSWEGVSSPPLSPKLAECLKSAEGKALKGVERVEFMRACLR